MTHDERADQRADNSVPSRRRRLKAWPSILIYKERSGTLFETGKVHNDIYDAFKKDPNAPLVIERPPLFSSAAAAQDEGNPTAAVGRFGAMLLPLEYTSWVDESASHVDTCYLGDWSPLSKAQIRGPGAHEFLSRLGTNNLGKFRLGTSKHHVQLDENGWIASEGILRRTGEQEYVYTAGSTSWLHWQAGQIGGDVEVTDVSAQNFIFGVQGPRSLAVLQLLTDEDLSSIPFNGSTRIEVAGTAVDVLRTGISGELGYELHGPSEAGNEIWRAVRDAGVDHDLRQLGFRSQPVQHVEAGIATNGLDFLSAAILTPGGPWEFKRGLPGGSFVPNDLTDYFRRPGELGWGGRVHLDHEFIGRDALTSADATGGPARTLVGLEWNTDDVVAIYHTLFEPGDRVDPMELPKSLTPSFDRVMVEGTDVGVSSGREYSANLRSTLSLAVIDRTHAEPGTAVVVVWGRPGTRQVLVRATVRDLPFKPDRRRSDTTAVKR